MPVRQQIDPPCIAGVWFVENTPQRRMEFRATARAGVFRAIDRGVDSQHRPSDGIATVRGTTIELGLESSARPYVGHIMGDRIQWNTRGSSVWVRHSHLDTKHADEPTPDPGAQLQRAYEAAAAPAPLHVSLDSKCATEPAPVLPLNRLGWQVTVHGRSGTIRAFCRQTGSYTVQFGTSYEEVLCQDVEPAAVEGQAMASYQPPVQGLAPRYESQLMADVDAMSRDQDHEP
jgi:hypothetical protein